MPRKRVAALMWLTVLCGLLPTAVGAQTNPQSRFYAPLTQALSPTVETVCPDTDSTLWALGFILGQDAPMAMRLHRNGTVLRTLAPIAISPNDPFRPQAFGDVARLSDGTIVLAGYAETDAGPSVPGYSPFLAGYDSAFNPLWVTLLELGSTSSNTNGNLHLLPLPDGDFLLATSGYLGGDLGVDRLHIFRLNPAGGLVWQRQLGATSLLTTIHDIRLDDADGSVHIIGGHHITGLGLGGLHLRFDPATGSQLSGFIFPIATTPQFDLEFTSLRTANNGTVEVAFYFDDATSNTQAPGMGIARLNAQGAILESQLIELPNLSVYGEAFVRSASHPIHGHLLVTVHTIGPFGAPGGIAALQMPSISATPQAVDIEPQPGYNVIYHGLVQWGDGMGDYLLSQSNSGFQRIQIGTDLAVSCLDTQPTAIVPSAQALGSNLAPVLISSNIVSTSVPILPLGPFAISTIPLCECNAIAPPDTAICPGHSIVLAGGGQGHLAWQPAPGLADNGNGNAILTPSATGLYVLVADSNACVQTDTVQVTVLNVPPPPSLGPDVALCAETEPFPLVFNVPPGYDTYLWQDGTPNSSLNYTPAALADSIAPSATDTLWVQATHTCRTARDTVVVRTDFTWGYPIQITGPAQVCSGKTVPLVVHTPLEAFQWNTGSTADTLWASTLGTYTVTGATPLQCARVATFTLGRIPALVPPGLPSDTALCPFEDLTIELPNAPYSTILWNDGSTVRTRVLVQPGTYSVTVGNACGSVSDTVHIAQAGDCEASIWFPSAVVAGSATGNGLFGALHPHQIDRFRLEVFNRWGQPIFATEDPAAGWDATHHTTPVPEGIYAYRAEFTTRNQPTRARVYTGTVTVIR